MSHGCILLITQHTDKCSWQNPQTLTASNVRLLHVSCLRTIGHEVRYLVQAEDVCIRPVWFGITFFEQTLEFVRQFRRSGRQTTSCVQPRPNPEGCTAMRTVSRDTRRQEGNIERHKYTRLHDSTPGVFFRLNNWAPKPVPMFRAGFGTPQF